MEYSWAFADERAKQGDTSRIARMLPGMTEPERQDARPVPAKAIEAAREGMASSLSRNPKAKAAPRPSTAPDRGESIEEAAQTGRMMDE